MLLKRLEVGNFGTNCYLIGCERTKQGAVIDPGANSSEILQYFNDNGLKLQQILLTHAHADHIMDLGKVKQATNALVAVHSQDADMLGDGQKNLSVFFGGAVSYRPDRLLADGDQVKVGDLEFTVIHTPGHTPGGICLYANKILFSGDTLFQLSIGRTDFPGGSYKQLIQSITGKLYCLPDDTVVYPGHGPQTTISDEKANNPFTR